MAIKKIFKSTFPHLVFVTKKGKNLYFTNNRFITDNIQDIHELADEIKSGHPHLYIDPNEAEIDTTLQDKIAEAQKNAALAVLEEHAKSSDSPQAAQTGQTQGTGQSMSAATLLNVSSTASLAGLAALSSSPAK